jgi:alkaline phosphatase
MIEESATDAHTNDAEAVIAAVTRLDDATAYASQFIHLYPNTAIIVTADHETGGLKTSANAGEYPEKFTSQNGTEFSYEFSTTSHTKTNVPFYFTGFGVKAELLGTFSSEEKVKNSEIFLIVRDLVLHGKMV